MTLPFVVSTDAQSILKKGRHNNKKAPNGAYGCWMEYYQG